MGYIAKVGDYVKSEKHVYQILAEINKGGFADAYKARSDDGTIVFLKQYKSPSKLVPWFKPYFSYEAELNHRLKEDPVLQNATVYANEVFCSKVWKDDKHTLWTKNECLFQVFPFISGNTNLADMIQKGFKVFDWQKRLYACTVFAFALRKLHDADVIHCDLKPENVQVKLDDTIAIKYRPLLVDMDWSILSDKKAPWHGKQGYVGTVGYSSPEHLKDEAPLEASDVFTAAIIMCEVMANAHPFDSHLGQEDFNEYVLSGKCDFEDPSKIPFVGEVTDKFRELIFNALNVKASKRPTMTEIHLEMMAMCKAAGKPKAPSIIKTAISSIGKKEEVAESEVKNCKPKTGPRPPMPTPFVIVPPARKKVKAKKPAYLGKITLTGDKGKFSTRLEFIVDQSVLKNITSFAKYTDSYEQFRIVPHETSWSAYGNSNATNLTYINGHKMNTSCEQLKTGDVIQLKGKASGKLVDLVKVEIV